MFFSCGLSNYYIAFFHLWNHAFFKALLFLSAGSVIHACFDEQDMRRLGRFREFLPFTYCCFCIGSLAIMGFPFLTGFYSKDLILEFAYSRFIIDANFIYFLGLTSAMCTAIYSFRLLYFVFLYTKITNGFRIFYNSLFYNEIECSWQMFISMFVLAFCSISIGYISSDLMMGLGQTFWHDSITVLPEHFFFIDSEFIHPLIKNLPVILSLFSMYFTWFILYYIDLYLITDSHLQIIFSKLLYPIFINIASWGFHAGFFNTIYNYFFRILIHISYENINKYLDKGLFEYFGPFGIYKSFRWFHLALNFSLYSLIYFSISILVCGIIWLFSSFIFSIYLIKFLGIIPLIFWFLYLNEQ